MSNPAQEKNESDDLPIEARIELQDEQLKQIEQEQKQFPLVGQILPFETIIMEYDQEKSPDYYAKAKELAETYSDVRQIRGDGNCFYRCFLVGILEDILKDKNKAAEFHTLCTNWKDRLLKVGFPEWTTTDFCDFFISWVKKIVDGSVTHAKALEDLNDDYNSNYLIIFIRLITSGYLKENSELYQPFIEDGQELNEYCASEIEAMWKDVEHLGIIGLVNATGYKIRIEYMDRSAAPNGGWHYDIPDDDKDPQISVLYRPGHYDLIYKKSD